MQGLLETATPLGTAFVQSFSPLPDGLFLCIWFSSDFVLPNSVYCCTLISPPLWEMELITTADPTRRRSPRAAPTCQGCSQAPALLTEVSGRPLLCVFLCVIQRGNSRTHKYLLSPKVIITDLKKGAVKMHSAVIQWL